MVCDHGGRRVYAVPVSVVREKARAGVGGGWPRGSIVTLADAFEGRRLNSPNDAVFAPNGDLLFTDPSYGLQRVGAAFTSGVDSPDREQATDCV